MNVTDSVELPRSVVTTTAFAPTPLSSKSRTGVTKLKLVELTLVGMTETPSIVTVVEAGSKSVPETVTVVPPAAVPDVGEIEVTVGTAEACDADTSPKEIRVALIVNARKLGKSALERNSLANEGLSCFDEAQFMELQCLSS